MVLCFGKAVRKHLFKNVDARSIFTEQNFYHHNISGIGIIQKSDQIFGTEYFRLGDPILFGCQAYGDDLTEIVWFYDEVQHTDSIVQPVKTSEDGDLGISVESQISISAAAAEGNAGSYKCQHSLKTDLHQTIHVHVYGKILAMFCNLN